MKTPLLLSSLLLSFLLSGQAQEVSPNFTINWSAPIPDSEIFLVSNDKNLLYYAGFEKRVRRKKKLQMVYGRVDMHTQTLDTRTKRPISEKWYKGREAIHPDGRKLIGQKIHEYYRNWDRDIDGYTIVVNINSLESKQSPIDRIIYSAEPDLDRCGEPKMYWTQNDSLLMVYAVSSRDNKDLNAFIDLRIYNDQYEELHRAEVPLDMPFDHVRVPHMTLLNDGRICYVAYTSEKDLDREKMKDYHKRNYSLHILSPDKAQSNRRDIKTGDRCFNHTNMWADASGERIIFYGSQLPNGEDVDGHFLVTTSANGTEEIDVQWFTYDDAFTEELANIMRARECIVTPSGDFYLLFENHNIVEQSTKGISSYKYWAFDIFVFAHDSSGQLKWKSHIERPHTASSPFPYVFLSPSSILRGKYVPMITESQLHIFFADHKENSARRKEGEELKVTSVRGEKENFACVSIETESGASEYAVISPILWKDAYHIYPGHFVHSRNYKRVVAFAGGKEGFIFGEIVPLSPE